MKPSSQALLFPMLALAVVTACERPSRVHDIADQPHPQAREVGDAAADPLASKAQTGLTQEEVSQCARGTGRRADGQCVQIGLRELDYVQRVQIPSGDFVMGYVPTRYDVVQDSTLHLRWSGQPPRLAHVDSFWIDLHEVTRAAYAACVDKGQCTPAVCPPGAPDLAANASAEMAERFPQTCVTWSQAKTFCEAHEGRLPSEEEWEYAARGVDGRRYPWGNDVKDDLEGYMSPAGSQRLDTSYFGILGMGSNAFEWVADVYDAEVAFAPYLAGRFRDAKGPLAQAMRASELAIACGGTKPCDAANQLRHVVKVGNLGWRRAGWDAPATTAGALIDAIKDVAVGSWLGFRCAADPVAERDPELTVPAQAPTVPTVHAVDGVQIFGGVAEAVTRAEAEAFCRAVRIPDEPGPVWHLPSFADVVRLEAWFRGPGPFWTSDGAAFEQTEKQATEIKAAWKPFAAKPRDPLLARCIREMPAPQAAETR